MALDQAKKQEIIAKYARGNNDTGSTEVQVALITERIVYLTEHLKTNKKDHSSRLGLLKLVGQRKRLMRYLKNTDLTRWNTIKADKYLFVDLHSSLNDGCCHLPHCKLLYPNIQI